MIIVYLFMAFIVGTGFLLIKSAANKSGFGKNNNKKITRYENGEKVLDEEITTTNSMDKKAVVKCPNCSASVDMELEKCTYCGTKIN